MRLLHVGAAAEGDSRARRTSQGSIGFGKEMTSGTIIRKGNTQENYGYQADMDCACCGDLDSEIFEEKIHNFGSNSTDTWGNGIILRLIALGELSCME